MINYLYTYIFIALGFSRILLISDTSVHPLEEISVLFNSVSDNISIIYSENVNILDTLNNLTANDIIFWEKDNEFTDDEKFLLSEYNNLGGCLVLFGKSIFDDQYYYIEEFGGTYLRDINSENIIFNDNVLYLEDVYPKIEFQLVSNLGNIIAKYNSNSISSIAKLDSKFILNGFWIEEIHSDDRQLFINHIFNYIDTRETVIELESIFSTNVEFIFSSGELYTFI